MRRLLVFVIVPFAVSSCGGGSPTAPTPAAVACATIALSSTALTMAAGGGATSIAVTATPSNCTWTAVSGNAFLRITSSATGTGNGSFTFTTDPNTQNTSRNGTITVGAATVAVTQDGVGPPLVFAPQAPPNGTVGVAYTHNFAVATGGVPPLTYSLDSGGFAPNGLILSPAGVLSGTPTAPTPLGGMTFRVCVTDGAGNRRCTDNLTITIVAAAAAGPSAAVGQWSGTLRATNPCSVGTPVGTYQWSGRIDRSGDTLTFTWRDSYFETTMTRSFPAAQTFTFTINDQYDRITLTGRFSADYQSLTGEVNGRIDCVVVVRDTSGTWEGRRTGS